MITNIDKLTEHGCSTGKSDKVCRSRGGESCAFDGAMIVLQPIADTAHLVHGPIACCGNSWEGRGTRSSQGSLHKMGFTTDMTELDIVYGSEEKLYRGILKTADVVKPKAIFVYATCVSGLIGEDVVAVCKKAEEELGIRVIPVSAPGFVGPKNLGNRIAGEVLLEHVIGTGERPENPPSPPFAKVGQEGDVDAGLINSINLIGEYNIAGDLWLIEPVLKRAGITILSRMTGNATFEEITRAHQAKLNVVVCSRALINIAKGMEQKYGIPYLEVSFFGRTEMAKALRAISDQLSAVSPQLPDRIEEVIAVEEQKLHEKLRPYEDLRGKKAVLYTGGVKSWSFISALMDLGIEIVAVGTKKSTAEDEEKMKQILGNDALLVEDVTPKNLKKLLRDRGADILVAGGRNQYLAIKEGYPFIDVNQERHVAYAGYDGLVNIAEQISNSIRFYSRQPAFSDQRSACRQENKSDTDDGEKAESLKLTAESCLINPLKHSASIGAAMALQGIDNALPVIHGAQGCTFLGKVLLTKHFREPIALAGTKLFAEDVVMGSDEALSKTVGGFIEKNSPDMIGVLTSGLTEVKGDDIAAVIRTLTVDGSASTVLHIPTPDYEGGLETGYTKAVEALVGLASAPGAFPHALCVKGQVNILAGSHLTPADFLELREMAEAFGLRPIILPDLSCLDGSRQGISPLASGGTTLQEIAAMGSSEFTIAIGMSLEPAAQALKERFGVEYRVFDSLAGLEDTSRFMEMLGMLAGRPVPTQYERQRRILSDSMRDAHAFFASKRICIALEPDHALQTSKWVIEMAADISLAVVPQSSAAAGKIQADSIAVGDLFSINGEFDLIISNSHAEETAKRLGTSLLQTGFPVYKVFGNTNRITIGYRGTQSLIQEAATLFAKEVHS
ncbi:MAG: nitrogenase iron-molybdenum cofactor biosynthesis protein NifE [Nitrospirae bacterium]|nr:nitrogenase iron-molybdenum cofactor biosynthesis protein NifE [Nitrospirota bacterium]